MIDPLVIVTILAVFVALFGKTFWDFWNRPKIKFGIKNSSPYIVQNLRDNSIVFYFRMKVVNTGKTMAKNCQIKITSVIPENKDTIFFFEPDKLKWSSAPKDTRYTNDEGSAIHKDSQDIPPNGGWEFCDLFDICNGFVKFISYGIRPSLNYYENYLVTAEIFGDNFKPRKVRFKISPSKDLRQVKIDRII